MDRYEMTGEQLRGRLRQLDAFIEAETRLRNMLRAVQRCEGIWRDGRHNHRRRDRPQITRPTHRKWRASGTHRGSSSPIARLLTRDARVLGDLASSCSPLSQQLARVTRKGLATTV